MSWVGLQCVIVVVPDHTHLHFFTILNDSTLFSMTFIINLLRNACFKYLPNGDKVNKITV